MKQTPVEKYTIAFFKLAEYVSRGEKERALGMYRLLSHSFHDVAFARQLEGDILWSFKDETAQDKYFQAAQLYQKDMRLRQAAGVYEHLLVMHPKSALYMINLIEVYCQLEVPIKAKNYLMQLPDLALNHAHASLISQTLITYQKLLLTHERADQHEKFLCVAIKSKYPDFLLLQGHVKYVIDCRREENNVTGLESFLNTLHMLDGAAYLHAYNYYKSQ